MTSISSIGNWGWAMDGLLDCEGRGDSSVMRTSVTEMPVEFGGVSALYLTI